MVEWHWCDDDFTSQRRRPWRIHTSGNTSPTTRASSRGASMSLIYQLLLLALVSVVFVNLESSWFSNHFKRDRANALKQNAVVHEKEIVAIQQEPPDKNTHWCIISKDYSMKLPAEWFNHFPHASEVILPCWSWFRRQNATQNCGFVLMDGLKLNRDDANSWQQQLVKDVMGCKVREFDTPLDPQQLPLEERGGRSSAHSQLAADSTSIQTSHVYSKTGGCPCAATSCPSR